MKQFLFSIFAVTSLSLFAQEVDVSKNDEIAKNILRTQPNSVESYVNGKLYLKTDRILATAQGLLLRNASSAIQLPFLQSDNKGCYLSVRDDLYIAYVCTNERCGNMWEVWKGSNCPICGSPGIATAP